MLIEPDHFTPSVDRISVDEVPLPGGHGDLQPGAVLGQITVGTAATAAPFSDNTGDGVLGEITASSGANVGDYTLVIIEPEASAGRFQVEGPDGVIIGTGVVGAPFGAGGLAVELAAGVSDFAAGDGFTITVPAGSGTWVPLNPAASDGSQHATGVLLRLAVAGVPQGYAAVRLAALPPEFLVWPDGISPSEKAAAIGRLAAVGVVIR